MRLINKKQSKVKMILISWVLISCILGTTYSVNADTINNKQKTKKSQVKDKNKSSKNNKDKNKKNNKSNNNKNNKSNNNKNNKKSNNTKKHNTQKSVNKRNSKTNNRKKNNKKNNKPKLTSNSLVKYAYKFKGQPYLWGGNTPRKGKKGGFDCSGFVQYVYKHFGVNVGRTTYDQVKRGRYVSRKKLKKGDLVFFGTKKNVYHVGIYVGNNRYIHSPKTGDVVKISPLNRSDYVTARRIITK